MNGTFAGGLIASLLPLTMPNIAQAYSGYSQQRQRGHGVGVALTIPAQQYSGLAKYVKSAVSADNAEMLEISSGVNTRELIIIDEAVPEQHRFYQNLPAHALVAKISSQQDGWQQLVDILSQHQHLSAVHLVSHANDGELKLGNSLVNTERLHQEIDSFATFNQAIKPGGDILFYGCDLASTQQGEEFLALIKNNTHTDVAASNDPTGHFEQGGDWELEIHKGDIEAKQPFSEKALADFTHTLAINDGSGGTIDMGSFPIGSNTYVSTATYSNIKGTGFELKLVAIGGNGNDIGGTNYGYVAIDSYGENDVTRLELYFSGGQTFDVSSINIYNGQGSPKAIKFTSDQSDSQVSSSIGDTSSSTINLSGFTGITKLTIENNDSTNFGWIQLDDLVISNAQAPNTDPTISNVTYDVATGNLVVTGTNFDANAGAANDVTVNKFTITGEDGGGSAYTLTSSTNIERDSSTQFTVPISGTDKLHIDTLLNKNGTSADDSTTYNLAAADDFIAAITSGDTAIATNAITVSNVSAPTVTSATYNASTGTVVVTGTGFTKTVGATNDIDISAFTFTGSSGGTHTVTSSSDVEITSGTEFSFTLSGADKTSVDALLNKNGTSATDSTTYNLAAADNWMAGAATSTNIADTTGNGITVSNAIDSDGSLTAAVGVSEPVNLPTTTDTVGEATDVFDFTLSDGGGGDGAAMTVSQIVLNVSGTSTDAERANVTWRLDGNDASNVTGTYSAGGDTITFSGLSISVADGASETYTVNAYFNDNTGISEDATFVLSVDGDTDLTVGGSGSQMGSTSAVTNGVGGAWDVVATTLAFSTQPAGSVSGSALSTQPVVTARDAFGNTDVDFTQTVTLTEASVGTLSGNAIAAVSGVATFTAVNYTASADQESFTLSASATGVTGTSANAVTSDVLATQLVFTTQPAGSVSGSNLTTQPVVTARDANGVTDTGFTETITLTEASLGSLTGGSVAAVAGVATFTGVNYTASADQESFTLTADDQAGVGTNLSTVDANVVTSDVVATGLVFGTQPAGSISGVALTTQPVVNAVDGDGTIDTGFTETITLTENGSGSITGSSVAAVAGVATFSALTYTATADQENFTLTANDQDGVGADFATVDANQLTSDVVATQLVFTTQPAGSVSGSNLTTQPVVTARDASGLTDTGFTETITLTEASLGTLTGGSVAAVAGVATFTAVNYTASADRESFTLTANDQDGVGTNISTTDADAVTSDVIATQLVFSTQPAPLSVVNGIATNFTTVPVVQARDGDGTVDTGYSTSIVLSEINGAGSAALTGTGDTDIDGTTVTLAPTSGVATFTGAQITYTASGGANENFNLQATSSGLTSATSNQLTGVVPDSDATLTASASVTEPVAISTTLDSSGEALDIFDFTISDGGTADGLATAISQIQINTSGTLDASKLTYVLNGPDATDAAGSYSSNVITFSSLSISVADGASETYTVSAYYNDNTGLTEDQTLILSVDGDTNLTVSSNGSQFGSTSAVTNSTGSTVDVIATTLAFTTQPAGSISGSALSTQPVVTAQDAFGNTDTDFTGTVTLSEASAGALTGNSLAATAGVATFTALTYTASADQESFTLSASATGVTGASANAVTSDVVAIQLAFTTQPAGSVSGSALTTQPVVTAQDANGTTDTGFTETITLTEASAGSLSGDIDIAAVAGVATFTDVIYTATADQQSFTLAANDEDGTGSNLATVNANAVTSDVVATKLVFTTEPAPTSFVSAESTNLTTVPVVTAQDANNLTDTGHSTGITLAEVNGAGSATMTATGDTDGSGATVTVTPSSGVATFTGMALTYTASGASNENFNLQATSGSLTAATSRQLTGTTLPIVSDGNISISGASGTSGAYKIGDTVTATWDNTASGDDNSGITTVTVDFSDFGGGSSVSASESSGTWTATYTIVAGAIDATNANISVTATNGSGPTTTSDTTNATVDNIAPTITDNRLSISVGSGTGGAYIIGDTVTASWDNTASGDNNSDTIDGVTVNFSAFGGGSAVAASESAGTWSASYTLVAGSIDNTNLNISATATDNAGNTTTTIDTTNATADNIAPTVTDGNISISGASGTGGAYIIGDTVTAVWDNTASGDGSLSSNTDAIVSVTADFSAFGGGAAVTASESSGTWSATYALVAGSVDGTNLNVSITATDDAGITTTTADSTNATVDNVAPTLTDGHLSISGASGTGGAFISGDTVTATWNNTSGGDNNSDTITDVNVDFSDFGGGSTVSASESSGTWTATYTLTSGSLDGSSLNISATATDNAGNTTTTADTTNATADNQGPTVSAGNISLSGATGTSGAFKIGDTVTATWDNTATGDNNSDAIAAVTMNFSAFGAGSVAASESSGTWTAAVTLSAGTLDGTNLNVSTTATDNAGNNTTTTGTNNATADNQAATVTDGNLSLSGASGNGGEFIAGDTLTATWDNTASGDNNSDTLAGVTFDFSSFGGGSAVAASESAGTWTASYAITSASTQGSNLNASATVTDNAGNITTTADTTNASVDSVAPTLAEVTAVNTPSNDNTPAVTFSTDEAGTLAIGGSCGSASEGAITSGNNTISLTQTDNSTALAEGSYSDCTATVTDSAGNTSSALTFTSFSIDTNVPTVTITSTESLVNTAFTATIAFSEDVTGFSISDISAGNASLSNFTATSASVYTVTVTPTSDGAVTLDVAANVALDTAGNNNTAATQLSVTYDGTAPTAAITSSTNLYNAAFTATVTFSEAVTGFTIDDISAGNASLSNFTAASGTVYTVLVTPAADGAVTLDVAANVATDSANNGNTAATQLSVIYDTAGPTLASTTPAAGGIDINRNTDITLTFSEAISAGSSNNTLALFDAADDSMVASTTADNGAVVISGNSAVWTTGVTLTPSHSYYLQVGSEAFYDVANNYYAGISDSSLSFTVFNATPVANNDSETTNEDNAVAVDVLANDTDSDSTLNAASTTVTVPPTSGSTSVNTATGVIIYTPDADFNGSDSFTYTVSDVYGKVSNGGLVTLTVSSVNDAPVAVNDMAITAEDNAVSIDVAANDTDVDTGDSVDTATLVVATQPTKGTAVVTAGEIVYTPNANTNGTDSFTYTIEDQNGGNSNAATVMINVTGVNDLPVASDDTATTDEDHAVAIDVLANDSDIDGIVDATTVMVMTNPQNGSVSIDAITGEITYTPNADFNGTDSFTYVVQDDSNGTSNAATVTITVNSVNDAPVAGSDTAVLLEDEPHIINVVGNDSDVDGTLDNSSLAVATAPTSGNATVNGDGTITYTPNANFNGSDSFTYTIDDNEGATSNAATVTITVTAVNDDPLANDDTATTDEDAAIVIDLAANDSDVDGTIDGTSFTLVTAPTLGTVASNDDGTVTYTPTANANGSDSFTYTFDDDQGATSNAAAVTVTVNAVNDAPTITGTPATSVAEDSSYSFTPSASDIDSATLTFSQTGMPAWASFDTTTGTLSGTPTNDDVGTSGSIVITVSDGELTASLAAFTITVTNTNDAPVISGMPAGQVDEDGTYTFTPTGSDVDAGDNLTYTATNLPSWASIDPATGVITGTPTNDDVGIYRDIVVTVDDGTTTTSLPAFSLTVANTNDVPVAAADSYTLAEGGVLQTTAETGVLANDVDVDAGDQLTATLITGPTRAGNFTLNTDGSFSYRHNGSETRSDSFTYALSDGTVTLPATTVSLAITAVNDAPRFTSTPSQTAVIQGNRFSYTPIIQDPDSVVDVEYTSGPSWLSFDGTTLSGRAPLDAAVGATAITLTASDQSFDITQTFNLTVTERDTTLVDIATSWQGLPAIVDQPLTLTATLTHSAGPAVPNGELIVSLQGADVTASGAGCTAISVSAASSQYTCPFNLAAGASATQALTISRASEGNIVVNFSARDTFTQTEVGAAITDVSVTDIAVGQGNNTFNLANATSIASIDLDGEGSRELVAGTSLGGEVQLLRYDLANATATTLGTIANTGNTRQVKVGDINGDGLEDVIVVNNQGDATNVYYQDGALSFSADSQTQSLPFAARALLIDLDNDDLPELILGGRSNNLYIYPNIDGVYSQAPFVFSSPVAIVHFALRKRGALAAAYSGSFAISTRDAVKLVRFSLGVANSEKPQPNMLRKAGSEAVSEQILTFEELDSVAISGVTEIISQDLDNDGEEELVFSTSHTDNSAEQSGVTIAKIAADKLQTTATLGNASAKNVSLADFNGDGATDVLVANDNDSYQFYYGNGTATEWQLKDTIIFNPSTLVLPEDVDNDGLADVLIYEDESDEVNLYLSANDGTVGQTANLAVSASTSPVSNTQYQWQYAVTLSNPAANSINNVTLTTTLPAGIRVLSKPAVCTVASASITCNVASLPAGSEVFTFTLAASSKPAGSARATVTSDALDNDLSNNSATNDFAPLFNNTQVRVEGGGKSGGTVHPWMVFILAALLAIRFGEPLFKLLLMRIKQTQLTHFAQDGKRVNYARFKPITLAMAFLAMLLSSFNAKADERWFIEANLGKASSHWNASGLKTTLQANAQEVTITDLDDERGTQELTLGYRIKPMLAVELGYRDWGEISYSLEGVASNTDALLSATQSHYPASGKGAFAGLRASYWHGDNLEGYAKLSAWDWSGEYTTFINNEAHLVETGDTDVVVSVGMNGYFFERYSAGVVWQSARLEGQRNVVVGFSLGVRF